MTLQEIFQRIIRAHWVVICVSAVLPVLLVVVLEQRSAAEWTGSVRMQVVSASPTSTTEADAVSSRVLALATTPTLVSQALEQAGLTGDASQVAEHDVSATRLGESSVVEVAVTASSPERARALSAALVQQVVAFLNNGSRPALDERLVALQGQIARVDAQRNALTDQLARSRSRVQRQAIAIRIGAVRDQINELSAQRTALLQTKLGTDQAVIIDGDNPEVRAVPSGVVPRAALALVLGLLVGLALAVLLETLAPRLAGIRALGRTLAAPILGRTDQSPTELASTMTLAARRQGVETVVVMGVDARDDGVAVTLLGRLPKAGSETTSETAAETTPVPGKNAPVKASASTKPTPGSGRPRNGQSRQPVRDPFTTAEIGFSSLTALSPEAERTAGVVVVSTGTCHVRDVDNLQDRLTALRWPVIGIVQVTHASTSSGSGS